MQLLQKVSQYDSICLAKRCADLISVLQTVAYYFINVLTDNVLNKNHVASVASVAIIFCNSRVKTIG